MVYVSLSNSEPIAYKTLGSLLICSINLQAIGYEFDNDKWATSP